MSLLHRLRKLFSTISTLWEIGKTVKAWILSCAALVALGSAVTAYLKHLPVHTMVVWAAIAAILSLTLLILSWKVFEHYRPKPHLSVNVSDEKIAYDASRGLFTHSVGDRQVFAALLQIGNEIPPKKHSGVNAGRIKAQVVFRYESGNVIPCSPGVWVGEGTNSALFDVGDSCELVVAIGLDQTRNWHLITNRRNDTSDTVTLKWEEAQAGKAQVHINLVSVKTGRSAGNIVCEWEWTWTLRPRIKSFRIVR